MNYKNKREQSRLSAGFIAYKLGMPIAKYREVESGERGLSADKIETFNAIVNNSKEYKFEFMELLQQAKEWYNNNDFDAEIKKMGYTRAKLCKAMGVSNTKVWDYANHNRTSEHGMLEFYLFLTDENNRYYDKKIKNFDDKITIINDSGGKIDLDINGIYMKPNDNVSRETSTIGYSQIIEDPHIDNPYAYEEYDSNLWHLKENDEVKDLKYRLKDSEYKREEMQKTIDDMQKIICSRDKEIKILDIRCKAYEKYMIGEEI